MFTNRINQILQYYDLSASSFADRIDVGRSSISHLLSGRNKPSLEFVLKIVNSFEEVDLDWLLYGKGNFPKTRETTNQKKPVPSVPVNLFDAPEEVNTVKNRATSTGNIKRIVVFFEDGTFEAYEN